MAPICSWRSLAIIMGPTPFSCRAIMSSSSAALSVSSSIRPSLPECCTPASSGGGYGEACAYSCRPMHAYGSTCRSSIASRFGILGRRSVAASRPACVPRLIRLREQQGLSRANPMGGQTRLAGGGGSSTGQLPICGIAARLHSWPARRENRTCHANADAPRPRLVDALEYLGTRPCPQARRRLLPALQAHGRRSRLRPLRQLLCGVSIPKVALEDDGGVKAVLVLTLGLTRRGEQARTHLVVRTCMQVLTKGYPLDIHAHAYYMWTRMCMHKCHVHVVHVIGPWRTSADMGSERLTSSSSLRRSASGRRGGRRLGRGPSTSTCCCAQTSSRSQGCTELVLLT